MAFWGVEVKPGKSVTHSCEKARGRLRISQATLGISDATKKSIVQCNVGKRSPVLLCALLPNHTESCHLDLEFEEADDVVFSVIGPRSVYLTGYYVRHIQQSNPQSDTESYGVDIQDTQTEESSYHSDDDKYEDSFIDDDETRDFSPSPVLSNRVMDETTPENDKQKNRKGRDKRLKKKRQVVESSEDASSHESEDEDGYLLSVFKGKKAEKTTSTGEEANNIDRNLPMSNGNDQMHSLHLANPEKKRKERTKEEKTCEVQIGNDSGVLEEDKEHEAESSKNVDKGDHLMLPPPESSSGNHKSSKKRRKEQLDSISREGIVVKLQNATKDDKLEQELVHDDETKKNLPVPNGDQGQQIDNNVSINSEVLANANQPEKKKKKKMKKETQGLDLNAGLLNTDQTTNTKPIRSKMLSNGLIIEELANGPSDGKVASHGKKVKIFYTAMLKENGHIFDSNVGKTPCKFRLGKKEIIDGWNLGIEGMHVGDKRRLTIPPFMGFGEHGVGENVPPNSWLMYDIELVGVYR